MRNMEVLEALGDPDFQTELAQFNLEINVAPKRLAEHGDQRLRRGGPQQPQRRREGRQRRSAAHLVMIGILPTLTERAPRPQDVLSANPRYQLLSDEILAARGEDIVLDIQGPERLRVTADSIAPEAACTSTQLHVQVSPENFPAYWNASQVDQQPPARGRRELAVPAGQGAVARDPDRAVRAGHRHPRRGAQGPGRAARGCGSASGGSPRSSTSSRRTSATSRRCCRCSPTRTRSRCSTAAAPPRSTSCACTTARSTAGTARCTPWSTTSRTSGSRTVSCRPGRPSSTRWPTPPSTSGSCGRWPSRTGRSGRRCRSRPPRRTSTPPPSAGIDAQVYWPGVGQVPATELVVRRLLPLAATGPAGLGRRPTRSRARCSTSSSSAACTGAQRRLVVRRPGARPCRRGRPRTRSSAACSVDYRERMHGNDPVHTWD